MFSIEQIENIDAPTFFHALVQRYVYLTLNDGTFVYAKVIGYGPNELYLYVSSNEDAAEPVDLTIQTAHIQLISLIPRRDPEEDLDVDLDMEDDINERTFD